MTNHPVPPRAGGRGPSRLDAQQAALPGDAVVRALVSPVFVGRAEELRRLEDALEEVRGGTAMTAIVAGEAGIGKTRLVEEFATTARGGGARVLGGSCLPLRDAVLPYGPFVELLEQLVAEDGAPAVGRLAGSRRDDLARLLPGLDHDAGSRWQAEPLHSPVDHDRGDGSLRAVVATIAALADDQPVVLVLEDLHWAAPATLDLLVYLTHRVRTAPVLTVGTYRDDDLSRDHPLRATLSELERIRHLEQVRLGRLTRAEVAAQATAIRGRPLGADTLETLLDRTGGSPFFIEELLAARDLDMLPRSLEELLILRADALSDPARRLADTAAVGGRGGQQAALLAVAERQQPAGDRGGLAAAFDEVLGRGLLVADDDRYRFRHALTEQALYGSLVAERRRALHRAWAQGLLEQVDAGVASRQHTAGLIARHWDLAGNPAEALPAAHTAAQQAEGLAAYGEASRHLEHVMDLWRRAPDAADAVGTGRVELLERAATAAMRAGRFPTALARLREVTETLVEQGSTQRAGLLHARLAAVAAEVGAVEQAERSMRRAGDLVPAEPTSVTRAKVLVWVALTRLLQGDPTGVDVAAEAVETARAQGAGDLEAGARVLHGSFLGLRGEVGAGGRQLRAGRELAVEVGAPVVEARSLVNHSHLLTQAGRLTEALAMARSGMGRAEELGLEGMSGASLLLNRAEAELLLGHWDRAERTLTTPGWSGEGRNIDIRRGLRARLDAARGALDGAEAHLEATACLTVGSPHHDVASQCFSAGVEVAIHRDDLSTAVDLGTRGLDLLADAAPAERAPLVAVTTRACADLARIAEARHSPQRADHARSVAERLREAATEDGALLPLPAAYLLTSRAELRRLDDTDAVAAWTEAAEAWERLQVPYAAAYARYRQTETLLEAGGSRTEAGAMLHPAHRTARRLGADPLAAGIQALATRARIDLEPATEDPHDADRMASPLDDFGLTPREREVLGYVAAGHTNREIAGALFITESTAGVHVSNILRKMDANNRVEAAGVAHRLLRDPAALTRRQTPSR